jgi:hypothetical protein
MVAWPAGEGRRGSWCEGMTPRRLGARNSLGKARAGAGAEVRRYGAARTTSRRDAASASASASQYRDPGPCFRREKLQKVE